MSNLTRLTIISCIVFMSTGVTNPVLSLYFESLGASYAMIGLLGTVASLATILLSYMWGKASDHFGQRKIFLLIGLLTMSAVNGVIAVVPSYGYLFPLRIIGGAALSAYATSSLALMGDVLERHQETRGRRMGTFRGLSSLGFGVMAFLSGTIADRFSLRTPFAAAAILCFFAFLLAFGVREATPTRVAFSPGNILDFLRSAVVAVPSGLRRLKGGFAGAAKENKADSITPDPKSQPASLPLAPLLISAFIWSLVIGAVYAVWANYMVGEVGYSRTNMSRLWSLASTSEFPLMILAGWLSDRLGRLRMLAVGFIAWALVFAGYVLVPGMPWIVFVQLTRGFAYSAFTATAMTYATEVRSRSRRGEVSGLYNAAGGVGSIIGASMGGVQTQLMGFRAMIATNAALISGGAAYLVGVMYRRRGE